MPSSPDVNTSQVMAWGRNVCAHDPVLAALHSLFHAFAAEEAQRRAGGPLTGTAARRGLIDPSELRQALSVTSGEQFRAGEGNKTTVSCWSVLAQRGSALVCKRPAGSCRDGTNAHVLTAWFGCTLLRTTASCSWAVTCPKLDTLPRLIEARSEPSPDSLPWSSSLLSLEVSLRPHPLMHLHLPLCRRDERCWRGAADAIRAHYPDGCRCRRCRQRHIWPLGGGAGWSQFASAGAAFPQKAAAQRREQVCHMHLEPELSITFRRAQ